MYYVGYLVEEDEACRFRGANIHTRVDCISKRIFDNKEVDRDEIVIPLEDYAYQWFAIQTLSANTPIEAIDKIEFKFGDHLLVSYPSFYLYHLSIKHNKQSDKFAILPFSVRLVEHHLMELRGEGITLHIYPKNILVDEMRMYCGITAVMVKKDGRISVVKSLKHNDIDKHKCNISYGPQFIGDNFNPDNYIDDYLDDYIGDLSMNKNDYESMHKNNYESMHKNNYESMHKNNYESLHSVPMLVNTYKPISTMIGPKISRIPYKTSMLSKNTPMSITNPHFVGSDQYYIHMQDTLVNSDMNNDIFSQKNKTGKKKKKNMYGVALPENKPIEEIYENEESEESEESEDSD